MEMCRRTAYVEEYNFNLLCLHNDCLYRRLNTCALVQYKLFLYWFTSFSHLKKLPATWNSVCNFVSCCIDWCVLILSLGLSSLSFLADVQFVSVAPFLLPLLLSPPRKQQRNGFQVLQFLCNRCSNFNWIYCTILVQYMFSNSDWIYLYNSCPICEAILIESTFRIFVQYVQQFWLNLFAQFLYNMCSNSNWIFMYKSWCYVWSNSTWLYL
jgi:hypothetical protein